MSAEIPPEDGVFAAFISGQSLTMNCEGQVQLRLTVEILAKLENAADATAGTVETPLTGAEREVVLTFVADDVERLSLVVHDLERLEFTDNDISRLHAGHRNAVFLIQSEVHVRREVECDKESWKLVWPRKAPEPLCVNGAMESGALLAEKIAAARQKLREKDTTTGLAARSAAV